VVMRSFACGRCEVVSYRRVVATWTEVWRVQLRSLRWSLEMAGGSESRAVTDNRPLLQL
jgi:hypothetical protein